MLTVYQCSVCEQLAYSKTDAEVHQKNAHPETETRVQAVRFPCPRCGLVWNHPSDLRNHLTRDHRVWVEEDMLVAQPVE